MSDLHRIVSSPVIIKRVTKRPFIFYKKILFVFFDSEMQNFENCTQTVICFIFYNEIQNFETCTQTAIRISHKEIRNLTIYGRFSFVS